MINVLNALNKTLGFVQARSFNGEPITVINTGEVTIFDMVDLKIIESTNDSNILICTDGRSLTASKDSFVYQEAMVRVRSSTLLLENMLACI